MLQLGDDGTTFRASALTDAFADLLRALVVLAEGAGSATVLWAGEGSGVFIDMARSGAGLAMVVHAMAQPDYVAEHDWRPIRGEVLLSQVVDLTDLVGAVLREARDIRRNQVATDGSVSGWGRPFPVGPYERLEQVVRAG